MRPQECAGVVVTTSSRKASAAALAAGARWRPGPLPLWRECPRLIARSRRSHNGCGEHHGVQGAKYPWRALGTRSPKDQAQGMLVPRVLAFALALGTMTDERTRASPLPFSSPMCRPSRSADQAMREGSGVCVGTRSSPLLRKDRVPNHTSVIWRCFSPAQGHARGWAPERAATRAPTTLGRVQPEVPRLLGGVRRLERGP